MGYRNPANPSENFADRWNDENSNKPDAFFGWIGWLRDDIEELLNVASKDALDRALRAGFGDSPGGRVASQYFGQLPGASRVPTAILSRVAQSLIHFNVSHKQPPRWTVQASPHKARVKAIYRRNGFRPTLLHSNAQPLPKSVDLDFDVETTVPKPFDVYWQVVNTGAEAHNAGQMRGDFYDSSKGGRSRHEATKYSGTHWVEGFIVKNGVCIARTGEFVVNIR